MILVSSIGSLTSQSDIPLCQSLTHFLFVCVFALIPLQLFSLPLILIPFLGVTVTLFTKIASFNFKDSEVGFSASGF